MLIEVLTAVPQNETVRRQGLSEVKMRPFRWALIQHPCCSYEEIGTQAKRKPCEDMERGLQKQALPIP